MARIANDMELLDMLSNSSSPSMSTDHLAKAKNADPILLSRSFPSIMLQVSLILTHLRFKNVC